MIKQWEWEIDLRDRSDRQSAWWTIDGGSSHCTGEGIKTIPKIKKCKKAKWLSEEALQIAVKGREVKSKGEKERPIQFSSVTQSCPNLCDPMTHSTPGLPVHHQLLELTQTHVHWVSDAIQPSHPLSSPSPPAPNPSQHQRLFQWVNSSQKRWPKYLSFSFSIIPSKEHPGLISFRMGWLDLLAVQGTLKRLPQHHSAKASILWHSVFFIVQLSHSYLITGITIALTRCTFVGKVMSLLFKNAV